MFIVQQTNLNNSGLNDHLCTFVAREEGNVDTTILNGRWILKKKIKIVIQEQISNST